MKKQKRKMTTTLQNFIKEKEIFVYIFFKKYFWFEKLLLCYDLRNL